MARSKAKAKAGTSVLAVVIAGLILLAQQLGWIELSPEAKDAPRPRQTGATPSATRDRPPSEATAPDVRQTRIEPDARDTRVGPGPSATPPPRDTQVVPYDAGAAVILELFEQQRSDTMVEADGVVARVLPEDTEGSRHQRFIVELSNGHTVLIAHNIDLAKRVPVNEGERLRFRGEYEYNDRGGVVHWTHHDPKGWRDGGWIEFNGRRYQ